MISKIVKIKMPRLFKPVGFDEMKSFIQRNEPFLPNPLHWSDRRYIELYMKELSYPRYLGITFISDADVSITYRLLKFSRRRYARLQKY